MLYAPQRMESTDRWRAFPVGDLPLEKPVTIHWNAHAIPFVEAETDDDLAFALGLVHAHLRLGQIELFRRLSQGRTAAMAGPLAVDVDRGLKTLDVCRAVPEILNNLPPGTRRWLDRFADGLSFYQERADPLPVEFDVLNLEPEPFQAQDLLCIARLAGADLTWASYFSYFALKGVPGGLEAFHSLLDAGDPSTPSFQAMAGEEPGAARLRGLIWSLTRSGSNALVVSGRRAGQTAALMANDPHLGIFAPNVWLVAGVRSPSYHAVGLMLPGLPFIAVGRNPRVAWGGTNMRGISSHLFRLSPGELEDVRTRTETIRVRGWFNEQVKIRDSARGPIVSDLPFFRSEEPIALSWEGHRPSDEFSAFLAASRARDWESFRDAWAGYSVSAQNILYADADGHIGQILAYRQPILNDVRQTKKIVKDATARIVGRKGPLELPIAFDPADGFIASANNRPAVTTVPIALTYPPNDRVERLRFLVSEHRRIDVETLMRFQTDVFAPSDDALKKELSGRCPNDLGLEPDVAAVWNQMRNWDGRYPTGSRGAAAFQLVVQQLSTLLAEKRSAEESVQAFMLQGSRWRKLVRTWLDTHDDGAVCGKLVVALRAAAPAVARYPTWGQLHVQRYQHPLGNIPVIGARFRFAEYPAPGSNDTLMKAAHALSDERSYVTFGANARHISDLSDPDANWFVLLGGQDGWLTGPHLADQLPLWRTGGYIKVPLRLESVRATFSRKMRLTPG